jgi:hypothetical protein
MNWIADGKSLLRSQFRLLPWILGGLYPPVLIVLLLTALASDLTKVPISKITDDLAATLDVSPFFGTLSNIGILLWCACATICVFSALLLRRERRIDAFPVFLFATGLLTLFLMLDDLFLFHEYIAPRLLHVPQKVVLLGYAAIVSLYFAGFIRTILGTQFVLLLFALGFFGLSIVADRIPHPIPDWFYLFEDGFKLFGIVSWTAYFATTCFQRLESTLSHEPESTKEKSS